MLKKFSIISLFVLLVTSIAFAEDTKNKREDDSPFLPAWRLLNPESKQQFISGYQHAWKDAVKIIDIVITYLKKNPTEGIEALESMRNIYNVAELKPDDIVREIDNFYADPDNKQAPLSKAITTAKTKL